MSGKDSMMMALLASKMGGSGGSGGTGEKGEKGDKGDPGTPFSISKVYDSIAAMNAGYATDSVPMGGFVLINTGSVDDEDNAKLFYKGSSEYMYLTDMSGATGRQGPKGDKGDDGEGTWSSSQVALFTDFKNKLSDVFDVLCYTTESGGSSADAAISALEVLIATLDGGDTPKTLTGLIAIYDNSNPVSAGTALSALNEVVKATYSDGSQSGALNEGTDYALSGTLTAGQTNTVTVTGIGTYSGYSTSFHVTVSEAPLVLDKLVVTYDNSNAVEAGTALSELNEVVKAQYTNGTQTGILIENTDYDLSGALTPGQTNTITVTGKGSYAGLAAVTFSVTVKAAVVPVTGVSVSPTAKAITAGEVFTITATIYPSNATNKNVTWTSTAPSVASVTGNGLTATVNALTTGSATIKAVTADGSHEAACAVTVEAVVASNYWVSDTVTGGSLMSITFPISDFSASDFEKVNYIDITGDKSGTEALGAELSVLRLFRSGSGWDIKEVWQANQKAAGNDTVKSISFDNGISLQTTNYVFGKVREYTLTCYDDPTSLPVANIDEAYDNGLFNQVGGDKTTFKIMARRNGGLIKQAEGFTSIVIAEDERALSPSYNETNSLYMNKLTLTKTGETWGGVAETSLGNKTVSSATVEVSEDELFGNSVLSVSVKVITSTGGTTDLGFINANKYIGTIVVS